MGAEQSVMQYSSWGRRQRRGRQTDETALRLSQTMATRWGEVDG